MNTGAHDETTLPDDGDDGDHGEYRQKSSLKILDGPVLHSTESFFMILDWNFDQFLVALINCASIYLRIYLSIDLAPSTQARWRVGPNGH